MATIAVNMPAPAESPFLFRRAFLNAIRTAISQAQIDGRIDAATAVACNRALPPATPDKDTAA